MGSLFVLPSKNGPLFHVTHALPQRTPYLSQNTLYHSQSIANCVQLWHHRPNDLLLSVTQVGQLVTELRIGDLIIVRLVEGVLSCGLYLLQSLELGVELGALRAEVPDEAAGRRVLRTPRVVERRGTGVP